MADEKTPETKPAFELPADLKGKSAEEVAQHYASQLDRYKDYDDLKTKASQAEQWSQFGDREQVASRLSTFDRVAKALQEGKVVINRNGTLYAEDPANLTPAERRQVQQQGADAGTGAADWLEGYDELPPTQQATRMEKRFRSMLEEVVAGKEKQYGQVIDGARGESSRQVNTLLSILSQMQEHPELKLKDVLVKMASYAEKGAADPLKAAFDEFLTPAQIEAKAQARAAEIIAAERLKVEKERAEKLLNNSGSPLQNFMRNAKNGAKMSNNDIIANLREKGLLQ